jgi:hypothetical protein
MIHVIPCPGLYWEPDQQTEPGCEEEATTHDELGRFLMSLMYGE